VPPKYITIARRRGNEWFVAASPIGTRRDIDVPLSFLGSGAYNAEIYADGPNAAAQPKDSVLAKRAWMPGRSLKFEVGAGRRQRHTAGPGARRSSMRATFLYPFVLFCLSLPRLRT